MADDPEKGEARNLGTPERLDRVLHVTTPKLWLAVTALGIIVATVVAWAFLGSVPRSIRAEGVLLYGGGTLHSVAPSAGGRLEHLHAGAGDEVRAGDVLAELAFPETAERHRGAVRLAQERERILAELEVGAVEENLHAERLMARRLTDLAGIERADRRLIEELGARLDSLDPLAEGNAATRDADADLGRSLEQAQRRLLETMGRQAALEAEERDRRRAVDSLLADARIKLLEARQRVDEIESAKDGRHVLAPADGRVISVHAQPGDMLSAGDALFRIAAGGGRLEAAFFAGLPDGSRIAEGMPALVSPATARRQETGSIRGVVASVSPFHGGVESLGSILLDGDLARERFRGGTPWSGRITLTEDPSSGNGYAWTLARGAKAYVGPGDRAEIEVEIDAQPPAFLVLPWLRTAFAP